VRLITDERLQRDNRVHPYNTLGDLPRVRYRNSWRN